MIHRRGFTLIELLVSVALFVMAITIALFATVGSNGLLQRTETRGNILEGTRDSIDAIRRASVGSIIRDIAIVTSVSYANQNDDINPNIVLAAPGSNDIGLAVQVRKYGSSQRDNVCYMIGRGVVKPTDTKEKLYQFSNTGDHMIVIIFRLNATNLCEYSTILYRGQLSADGLNVGMFGVALNSSTYTCGSNNCSIGQIRYRLFLEEKQIKDKKAKRPAVDTSGSVPILTEQINVAPQVIGILLEPTGPLSLNPGQKVIFSAKAVYNDSTFKDITGTASYTATGGSFNTTTHEYTAGTTAGTYSVQAQYSGFEDETVVVITIGGKILTGISLSPESVCVKVNSSALFSVIGTYSDLSQADLTTSASYQLALPAHGTMSANQYTAGGSIATDLLTASYGGFTSNQATINIQDSCGKGGGGGGLGDVF